MRKAFRAIDALLICGKNTMMRAAINELNTPPEDAAELKDFVVRPQLEKILTCLRGNVSIIFTNGDLTEVTTILDTQVREAPAKVGALAPADVIIPAGPTGLDPRQTGFFGNLGIATKIVKAQIEILNENCVIREGDKIAPGQAALLDKLKIRPFFYKMNIVRVLMDGNLFDPAVLRITPSIVL